MSGRARGVTIAIVVALGACMLAAFTDRRAFFAAWLVSWLFLFGISLAAMALLYLHVLTGGEWGQVLRPSLHAIARALPVTALLALPLVFGLGDLFPWARPDEVARSELLAAKSWYLAVPAFVVRNAAWLVAWSALAASLRRGIGRRVAVAGLLLYLVTVTFVAVDWVASLVPEWYSTAIGIRLGASQFVDAFAATVLLARAGGRDATARDRQDFGNLLLTFCLTAAYFAFAQYLVIWGADLPRETSWFMPRVQTSWRYLGDLVIATAFVLPVIAMLFRPLKRNASVLRGVCALVLAGGWLDVAWLVFPSVRPDGLALHWIDGAALVAQGGLWLGAVLLLARRPYLHPQAATQVAHG
ncbi:MAG: hypothetical protein U1F48_08110 [Burkholderiales bacterium]